MVGSKVEGVELYGIDVVVVEVDITDLDSVDFDRVEVEGVELDGFKVLTLKWVHVGPVVGLQTEPAVLVEVGSVMNVEVFPVVNLIN